MTKVIGVRFKKAGKVYYFSPGEFSCPLGVNVVVETARGVEMGEVAMEEKELPDDKVVTPLKPVVRLATPGDEQRTLDNLRREKEAFSVCEKKIADHSLDMKLVDVEFAFDGNKILFYFTADGRVDFRELVKDLASVFRTRIELRQIGVRDEAKMLGGLGICGRPFCCSSFLGEFAPVSIKMAKEQGLSLNPTKISGTCGRLMCCLKYEQGAYEDLLRRTPKLGAIVDTRDGRGTVVSVNLLRGIISVRFENSTDGVPTEYSVGEAHVVKEGAPFSPPSDKEEEVLSAPPIAASEDASSAKPRPEEKKRAPQKPRPPRPKKTEPAKQTSGAPAAPKSGFVEKRAAAGTVERSAAEAPKKAPARPPIKPEGKIVEKLQRKTTPLVSRETTVSPSAPREEAKKPRSRGGRNRRPASKNGGANAPQNKEKSDS